MAVTGLGRAMPKRPTLDEIDRQKVRIDYDPLDDSLWVGLTSEPRVSYNISVDEDTMYQVDPDTNEVVGLEIEHFLYQLLHRPPDLDDPDS